MKSLKKLLLITVVLLGYVNNSQLIAQCTNASSWGNVTAPTVFETPVSISTCQYQSEYSTILSIVSGSTYIATSSCGGYITVRSGSYNGPVVAMGNAPLTFTATSSGTYYIHYNTNSACGTASSCCETTIIRISPCQNAIANGSVAAPSTGNTIQISTCQKQNEYATISGMLAGKYYVFDMSCGGAVTVRSGSPGGPIVAYGVVPLGFTCPSNGTYYVHYNTNNTCGTATNCCTSTVGQFDPPCENTSSYGSAIAPTTNGSSVTISSCQFQTEYATISGIIDGNTYSLTNSCGGYITVRGVAPDGIVIAAGNAPLTFTATSSGTYYVHYNTNSACGTATGCCTTTIACVSCVSPPAGPQDCEGANLVCSNSSFSGNASGYGNVQEINGANQGCMSIEHQSSWYYVNVGSNGTLGMTINPVSTDDYDWAIWGPFTSATASANCPPITTPLRCSWADVLSGYPTGMDNIAVDVSEDEFGDGWVSQLNVAANQIYITRCAFRTNLL